jgi:spermidine synthase
LILAVFLVGLGIGSSLGSAMARNLSNPRIALGWCQLGLCVCLAWAAYATSVSLPYWPINPSISTSLTFNFQLDLMRAIWVMLPGAILWGASFPLALAGVAGPGQDSGRLVGGVYAATPGRDRRRLVGPVLVARSEPEDAAGAHWCCGDGGTLMLMPGRKARSR